MSSFTLQLYQKQGEQDPVSMNHIYNAMVKAEAIAQEEESRQITQHG